jgi:phosphoglycerate dehydrogenase-like enzyme
MSRVLVTPRSFTTGSIHPELERLQAAGHELVFSAAGRMPTGDELGELVTGCDAWLAGIEIIDRQTLDKATELKVIARHGVGLDRVDLTAAAELGIPVVPSTGSNAEGVAELVVLHALSLRRRFGIDATIDQPAAWKRTRGSELQGRTAAVVGYGAIGSRVAHLLAAFDMEIRVFDPYARPGRRHIAAASIVEAITEADLVTLHCPPADEPIIGEAELAVIDDGATLVNTARGSLVDLDAVLAALESGRLGGYGCDVYASEPPDPHPLWSHPNVMTTPHLGGFTAESVQRSAAMAVDAILDALS